MLTGRYRPVDEKSEKGPRSAFVMQLMLKSDQLLGELKGELEQDHLHRSLERHTLELFEVRQKRLRGLTD
jgi:hypothetical protein